MEFKINALSIHEIGKRPNQEDTIYPALGEINNDTDRLFILCDGMGGHSKGEVASQTVCEAMSKTINTALKNGETFSERLLLDAIAAAYDLLDERYVEEENNKKMGTTMTFLMLHEGGATFAHIGDSRVYQIRPKSGNEGDVCVVTQDHSLVNDFIKLGEITPEEAKTHPQKNVITRAMQPNLEHRHKADIKTTRDIRPGDYFYMCSDGMLEQTSDDNLCFMLNEDIPDEEKRHNLIEMSKHNIDNHSAHLIHILDVQPASEIDEAKEQLPASDPDDSEPDDGVDIVTPEFEESKDTEAITYKKESSESAAVDGGTDTSAPFCNEQEKIGRFATSDKLMRGILACLTVAILAIGGVYLWTNLEKRGLIPWQSNEISTDECKDSTEQEQVVSEPSVLEVKQDTSSAEIVASDLTAIDQKHESDTTLSAAHAAGSQTQTGTHGPAPVTENNLVDKSSGRDKTRGSSQASGENNDSTVKSGNK